MSARIEAKDLKEQIDLGALVAKDLGAPFKRGPNYLKWPCPFHEEKTPGAFTVYDRRYECFSCGATGDIFTWQQARYNETFQEALQSLARLAGQLPPPSAPQGQRQSAGPAIPPGIQWQRRGRELLAYAQAELWAAGGAAGLAYLRAGGLEDETIKRFGLGWLGRGYRDAPGKWGLDLDAGPVWLGRGVLIPGLVDGALWYVKTRCFDVQGRPVVEGNKYAQVTGSKTSLYGANDLNRGQGALLLEGERDVWLAWQELADLTGAACWGGAAKYAFASAWTMRLLPFRVILAAYDSDGAGRGGSARQAKMSARVKPVAFPRGSDLTDFYTMGGDLRAWLTYWQMRLGVCYG